MKFILFSMVILLSACSKNKSYDKREATQVAAPEDVKVVTSPPQISGRIRDRLLISIHQTSSCTDSVTEYSASEFLSGIPYSASTTILYARVRNNITSICYPITSGVHDDAKSKFTIEKELITPKLPIQDNLIIYNARDVNNNPVTGLGPISFTVTPENIAPFTATFVEGTTLGTYESTISLGENYSLDLVVGQIPTETTRNIGEVVVTDDPYCYQSGRLAWTSHTQSGAGTNADPYLICAPAQMKSLADSIVVGDFTAEYRLMRTINMASYLNDGTKVFSIGESISFAGVFDGNNHSITNFKMKNSNKGLFASVTGGTIKNLKLHTNQQNVSPSGVIATGLMIDEVTTNQDVNLDNLAVTGAISLGSDLGIFGGVVGRASVVGSSQLNVSRIKSTLTISEINTSMAGGVFGQISSPTAGQAAISQVDSNQNWTTKSINAPANSMYAGVVASSVGATLTDIRSNFNFTSTQTNTVHRVGGIVAVMNSTSVANALAQGEIVVDEVAAVGGVSGEITNLSVMEGSVGLVNISGNNCTDVCGKVIGVTNSLDNTISELYTAQQTALDFLAINDTGISETSIDLGAQPNYFFSSANSPMNMWNFISIWIENASTLPTLNSSTL